MTRDDLRHLSPIEIFEQYNLIVSVLWEKKLIRSQNILGDYAESLVSEKLRLSLVENNSNPGFDATDAEGKRYQIKARRLTKENDSEQIGVIGNSGEKNFDYLIAVLFEEDFSVSKVIQVSYERLIELSENNEINLKKLTFRKLTGKNGVEDITKKFIDESIVSPPFRERGEATMADSLAEYIGVFDSSEIVPGGLNLSKNTGQRSKEIMLTKHRSGKS